MTVPTPPAVLAAEFTAVIYALSAASMAVT
jgi:hypothetical protein